MIEVEKVNLNNGILYYIKGTKVLHREDGPAFLIKSNRIKKWYYNGKLHREDGPAYIYPNISKEWYINGVLYNKEGWFQALNEEQKIKALYSEYFIRD